MSQTRRFISLDDARAPFFVGVDLGGTNIKVGVVDDLGRPLSWHTLRTEAAKGAAECGHMIIDWRHDARLCACGHTGHLEAYCGATSVTKRAQEALDDGQPSSVRAHLAKGEALTPLMLSQEAEQGDELATAIILDT